MCIVGATPGLSFFSLAQVSVSALHSAGVPELPLLCVDCAVSKPQVVCLTDFAD
jgi:hypothetical protein